jgi:hypothetical protein
MATLSPACVSTSGRPILELVPKWDECQFGVSGMKPGSGTGCPVLKLGNQFQNWVNGKITSSPVPGLGLPVPALGAPFWHGADLGTRLFQFWNWTTSARTGKVSKWGPTYIFLFQLKKYLYLILRHTLKRMKLFFVFYQYHFRH